LIKFTGQARARAANARSAAGLGPNDDAYERPGENNGGSPSRRAAVDAAQLAYAESYAKRRFMRRRR